MVIASDGHTMVFNAHDERVAEYVKGHAPPLSILQHMAKNPEPTHVAGPDHLQERREPMPEMELTASQQSMASTLT